MDRGTWWRSRGTLDPLDTSAQEKKKRGKRIVLDKQDHEEVRKVDVDGTEKESKNALRGSELPIIGGIQEEVADGPLGRDRGWQGSANAQSPFMSCASVGTVALNCTDEALASGLTFSHGGLAVTRNIQ